MKTINSIRNHEINFLDIEESGGMPSIYLLDSSVAASTLIPPLPFEKPPLPSIEEEELPTFESRKERKIRERDENRAIDQSINESLSTVFQQNGYDFDFVTNDVSTLASFPKEFYSLNKNPEALFRGLYLQDDLLHCLNLFPKTHSPYDISTGSTSFSSSYSPFPYSSLSPSRC